MATNRTKEQYNQISREGGHPLAGREASAPSFPPSQGAPPMASYDPTQQQPPAGGDPGMAGPTGPPAGGPPAGDAGMAGDPSLPPMPAPGMGDPQSMQGSDPTSQAIWGAFPSTDPNVLGQMVQTFQGQSPGQALMAYEQLAQHDQMMLAQRQHDTLQAIIGQLIGPSPLDAAQQAGPGVLGGAGGY